MPKKIAYFIFDTVQYYRHQGCSSLAASLAYATLLSLVPFMIVGFYVLAWFPIFKGTGAWIQEFILRNFVAASANVISDHLSSFMQQIRSLHWTNTFALITVSVLMIYNMVHAFNRIWQTRLRLHYGLSFVIYFLVLLFTPIFFGLLMLISSYLASLPLLSDQKITVFIKQPLYIILPYIFAFIAFTFINWIFPNAKIKLINAIYAGLFTTVLFETAKYLFSLYLTFFPTYRIIYGALAAIPIFLVWLYVSWSIILFGAVFCRKLTLEV